MSASDTVSSSVQGHGAGTAPPCIDDASTTRIGAYDAFLLNGWYVDPRTNSLSRDGSSRSLTPMAMEVLVMLARRSGELVMRNELIDAIWSGNFLIGARRLNDEIWRIRAAFGDDHHAPSLIKTVPRRGYVLLIAPCRAAEPSAQLRSGLTGHDASEGLPAEEPQSAAARGVADRPPAAFRAVETPRRVPAESPGPAMLVAHAALRLAATGVSCLVLPERSMPPRPPAGQDFIPVPAWFARAASPRSVWRAIDTLARACRACAEADVALDVRDASLSHDGGLVLFDALRCDDVALVGGRCSAQQAAAVLGALCARAATSSLTADRLARFRARAEKVEDWSQFDAAVGELLAPAPATSDWRAAAIGITCAAVVVVVARLVTGG